MDELLHVGSEESVGKQRSSVHLRSDTCLRRVATNQSISALFSQMPGDGAIKATSFHKQVEEEMNQLLQEYPEETNFIPLPLLHGLITNAKIMDYEEKRVPFHYQSGWRHSKLLFWSLWEECKKIHPSLLQETFPGTSLLPENHIKELLNLEKDSSIQLDDFDYNFLPSSSSSSSSSSTEENTRKTFLKRNVCSPPAVHLPPPRGSALRSFKSGGRLMILHAGGELMGDFVLSEFVGVSEPIKYLHSIPAAENIPGEIYQIEIQKDECLLTQTNQFIAVRFMYHVLIVTLKEKENSMMFSVIECLQFQERVNDIHISRYTRQVMIWVSSGNLHLWSPGSSSLRQLYQRKIPQYLLKTPSPFVSSIFTRNNVKEPLLQVPATRHCSFTSHPQVSIMTEGEAIYSLDFRRDTTLSRPLFALKEEKKWATDIMALRYDYTHPFHFSITTQDTVLLFDERYTAKPVREWNHLLPADPSCNLQFLSKTQRENCPYKTDSIISWSHHGKLLLHPYDLDDRTWKTSLLYHSSPLSHAIPYYGVNDSNSYVSLIRDHDQTFQEIGKKRFNPELLLIGADVRWTSSLSSGKKSESDSLLVMQLSRMGDVYLETFAFLPSRECIGNSNVWYDGTGHDKELLIRNPEYHSESVVKEKEYYHYDLTSFLDEVVTSSHSWMMPDRWKAYVRDHTSPLNPSEDNNEGEGLSPSEVSAEEGDITDQLDTHQNHIRNLLYTPQSLFQVWKQLREKISALSVAELYQYLLEHSQLQHALSYPGEQSYFWERNRLYTDLSHRLDVIENGMDDDDREVLFYVWCSMDPPDEKERYIQSDDSEDSQDDLIDNEGVTSRKKDNALIGELTFSSRILFVEKDSWDARFLSTFESEEEMGAASSLKKKEKTYPQFSAPMRFEPGDFLHEVGHKSLSNKRHFKDSNLLFQADYTLDVEKLKDQWGILDPDGEEETIPNSQYLSGTSLQRGQSLSQEGLKLTPRKTMKEKKDSQLSQASGSQSIAPSQEDYSTLFSLLGSDEDSE